VVSTDTAAVSVETTAAVASTSNVADSYLQNHSTYSQ